jgi:hypothetical protein
LLAGLGLLAPVPAPPAALADVASSSPHASIAVVATAVATTVAPMTLRAVRLSIAL